MRSILHVKRLAVLGPVLALALLIPASYSAADGLKSNDVCAYGGCCRELGSVCGSLTGFNINHYGCDE